ncbi:MAG: Uma2 family endonuclease [Desulfobacteraceae bacterium]|nr:Uma2 family endonuclease [Desulfobacteraceae bacterium]
MPVLFIKKRDRPGCEYKKAEYRGAGVREYYILDARAQETAFYRLDKNGSYRKIRLSKGDIVRSAVLPGFQFRVSDLYRQPSLEEMTEDNLYNGFVFPLYKKTKQQAEKQKQKVEKAEKSLTLEKQRAEKEKQRAEKEKQRACLLAAKLRELGIEPNSI